MNQELLDVQAGFRKGRGARDRFANICWIIDKGREFQKNIYFCFIDYTTALDYVDQSKLWKILKEMGIPDYLTCLLRNLYASQEATVRTRHGPSQVPCALQYSGLENSMDSIIHGVAKSRTWLSDFHFTTLTARCSCLTKFRKVGCERKSCATFSSSQGWRCF